MRFVPTKLPGVFVVEPERLADDRGHFARTWCVREFAARGLETKLVQCSTSYNRRRGTLRGMHYQAAPHEAVKLVRCTRGSVFDLFVDLRPESPSYGRWFGTTLSAENGRMLFVPPVCAHGYQSLEDNSEILYMASAMYAPKAVRGLRYDDATVAIQWPLPPQAVSDQDKAWPTLQELSHQVPS